MVDIADIGITDPINLPLIPVDFKPRITYSTIIPHGIKGYNLLLSEISTGSN